MGIAVSGAIVLGKKAGFGSWIVAASGYVAAWFRRAFVAFSSAGDPLRDFGDGLTDWAVNCRNRRYVVDQCAGAGGRT